MGIRKLKPTTPGQRQRSVSDFDTITKSKPEKSLLAKKTSSGGRNSGLIDFKRNKVGVPAVVHSIEYDPNRTCRIALLYYKDGEKRYILAPQGLQVGQTVVAGEHVEPTVGNAMLLKNVPLGTFVHNVELHPGKGGAFARSAGTYAQLVGRDGKFVVLRMPSGETRLILQSCMATVGVVGNAEHFNIELGKAGRNRWLGRKPHNRGVSMNPVDHPMGGGEGRSSGGHPRNRNGLPAKGYKTRSPKKSSNRFIISKAKK
jgi:large subunit ribosomal protein L2